MRVLELFAGTQSVGKEFRSRGHEVVSLDLEAGTRPTICCDILEWDYQAAFPPGHFDVIWCSPPCTEYSKAKTTAPRNLELADRIVTRTLQILAYFCPHYFYLENPQTGLLKTRQMMAGIPFHDCTYCSYGRPFRKATRLWHNTPWRPRPMCDRKTCPQVVDGRHKQTAQRAPGKLRSGVRMSGDIVSLNELHVLPPDLVRELADAVGA